MHGLKSIPGLSGNQCDIQVSLENLYIKPRQTKQNVTLNSGAWQISTNMGDGPGAQRDGNGLSGFQRGIPLKQNQVGSAFMSDRALHLGSRIFAH